jgi:hypothetical protein
MVVNWAHGIVFLKNYLTHFSDFLSCTAVGYLLRREALRNLQGRSAAEPRISKASWKNDLVPEDFLAQGFHPSNALQLFSSSP